MESKCLFLVLLWYFLEDHVKFDIMYLIYDMFTPRIESVLQRHICIYFFQKHASTGQRGARPNTMGFGMAGEFEVRILLPSLALK